MTTRSGSSCVDRQDPYHVSRKRARPNFPAFSATDTEVKQLRVENLSKFRLFMMVEITPGFFAGRDPSSRERQDEGRCSPLQSGRRGCCHFLERCLAPRRRRPVPRGDSSWTRADRLATGVLGTPRSKDRATTGEIARALEVTPFERLRSNRHLAPGSGGGSGFAPVLRRKQRGATRKANRTAAPAQSSAYLAAIAGAGGRCVQRATSSIATCSGECLLQNRGITALAAHCRRV